jgi:hypothetical protein
MEEAEEATMEMEPLSGCAGGGGGGGGDESLFCLGGWILGSRSSLASRGSFLAVIWIGARHRTASPDTAVGAAP